MKKRSTSSEINCRPKKRPVPSSKTRVAECGTGSTKRGVDTDGYPNLDRIKKLYGDFVFLQCWTFNELLSSLNDERLSWNDFDYIGNLNEDFLTNEVSGDEVFFKGIEKTFLYKFKITPQVIRKTVKNYFVKCRIYAVLALRNCVNSIDVIRMIVETAIPHDFLTNEVSGDEVFFKGIEKTFLHKFGITPQVIRKTAKNYFVKCRIYAVLALRNYVNSIDIIRMIVETAIPQGKFEEFTFRYKKEVSKEREYTFY